MRAGRPVAELERLEARTIAIESDETLPLDQRVAAALAGATTDAEEDAWFEWQHFHDEATARGVVMPVMPRWLADLAGITEIARVMLAALLERGGRVIDPVRVLSDRFRIEHRAHDDDRELVARATAALFARPLAYHESPVRAALDELREVRLVRGDERAVLVMRRAA